ncbi:hypothetical protein LX59_01975 [Azomonas agilis]|uniref:PasA protein n=1 Tax=Azomonas agilis TaxID=116849 RepID=A0A562I330_9GAMM|nr:DUF6586 family protein [Azomonas agilis]TWH65033.1 hypothetical protein LX59_01975 [Azomonas agilis]
MAQERYTRTNQKIYFAGLALEQWRQAELNSSLNAAGLVQAEREACIFHLYGAVLGLCQEVLGYYRFQQADTWTLIQIFDATRQASLVAPELAELLELTAVSDSWLSLLLEQYAALYRPLGGVEHRVLPTASEVEYWRQQLKALILRFREAMTEW